MEIVIPILIVPTAIFLYIWVNKATQERENKLYREIRQEKADFLISDRFKCANLVKADIQPVSGRPLKNYDIYTVQDSNNKIYDVKVFDTKLNDIFKVEKII